LYWYVIKSKLKFKKRTCTQRYIQKHNKISNQQKVTTAPTPRKQNYSICSLWSMLIIRVDIVFWIRFLTFCTQFPHNVFQQVCFC